MSEFNIIETYFTWDNPSSSVIKGVGDDAALLEVPNDKYLVTSVDTSISGVHFPKNTAAFDIGYKSLAVNLSDLAAMGASAEWFTLALTLPSVNKPEDKHWLKDFSAGLKSLAEDSACTLVGGDTTRGNLSITIQVMGFVNKNEALLRSGAKVGDNIFVTGTLGDASAGLASILKKLKFLTKEDNNYCQKRLNKPTARLLESETIKQFATSCIDVSDGLIQDLSHILKASNVGAEIDINKLPLSKALRSVDFKVATRFSLSGGDDYELLFTIPAKKDVDFLKAINFPVTKIGKINTNASSITDENGNLLKSSGFNHFVE